MLTFNVEVITMDNGSKIQRMQKVLRDAATLHAVMEKGDPPVPSLDERANAALGTAAGFDAALVCMKVALAIRPTVNGW